MRNEHTANQALADYNQKEWEQRQQWAKVLAAPAKPRQAKPVTKQGFFSRFFLRWCKMQAVIGDLWGVCYDKMTTEEKRNFGFIED